MTSLLNGKTGDLEIAADSGTGKRQRSNFSSKHSSSVSIERKQRIPFKNRHIVNHSQSVAPTKANFYDDPDLDIVNICNDKEQSVIYLD